MSLSNKILLGFFGFIFLYMTAAFTELRISGSPNVIDDKNSIAETHDIPGVSYLVLNDVAQEINVIGSDRAQLEMRSLTGNPLPRWSYKISGDTLTLSGIQSERTRAIRISVFLPETSLKGISVNNSVAIVSDMQSVNLNVSQKSGTIWMSDCRIGKMEMDLTQSTMNITDTDMDTVSARIDRSDVSLSSPVGLIQGSIKDHTALRLTGIREIRLKKDESSVLNLF